MKTLGNFPSLSGDRKANLTKYCGMCFSEDISRLLSQYYQTLYQYDEL